ncbi:MAG: 30S ribosomal protein S21 [bacterium]|nr:30S ribosomal protein S21 [bacterium]
MKRDDFEKKMKAFKRETEIENILYEIRKRERYEPPSVVKQKKYQELKRIKRKLKRFKK